MFKPGNISSDPDTSTHTPGLSVPITSEVDQSLLTINRFVTIALRSYHLGLPLTNDEIISYEEHMLTDMTKKGLVIVEEVF